MKNVPDGVEVQPAGAVMQFDVFQTLLLKNRWIQQLSDAVRLLAIDAAGGGWALDEGHFLHPVPDIGIREEPFFGHFAGSLRLHPQAWYRLTPEARLPYAIDLHSEEVACPSVWFADVPFLDL